MVSRHWQRRTIATHGLGQIARRFARINEGIEGWNKARRCRNLHASITTFSMHSETVIVADQSIPSARAIASVVVEVPAAAAARSDHWAAPAVLAWDRPAARLVAG
jgi:hypothetical protein